MGNNLIKVCAGIGVFAGLFVAHSCGESAGRGEIKELERTYSDSLATVRGLHSSDKALLKMYHEGRRDTITVTETVGVTETIDTPEALAIIVQQKEDLGWNFDGTFRLGYEWRSLDKHNQRSTRLFLELHDGYSLDGQFAKEPSSSVSLALSMGY